MASLCRKGLWKCVAKPGGVSRTLLQPPVTNSVGATVACCFRSRFCYMHSTRARFSTAAGIDADKPGQTRATSWPRFSAAPPERRVEIVEKDKRVDKDDPRHGYYVYPNMHAGCKTEAMPRYPTELSSLGLLRAGDWTGTVAFAASGSITAAVAGMDLLGCSLVGTITAVGGGTLRDALILNKKPFWIEEHEYLWMSIGASVLTFCFWQQVNWDWLKEGVAKEQDDNAQGLSELQLKTKYHGNSTEGTLLWWGDTIGIGAFCVIGAMNGCRAYCHPGICMICGMMTATFGGLTRDVLCNIPSNPSFMQAEKDGSVKRWQGNGRILHSKANLYASTALCGAGVYVLLLKNPVLFAMTSVSARIFAGASTAMGLRWMADTYGLGLPAWDKMSWKVDSCIAR